MKTPVHTDIVDHDRSPGSNPSHAERITNNVTADRYYLGA